MYDLTNSPAGALGEAGMANNSTLPKNMFANAPASFNNFGKGMESAMNGRFGGMFSKLFGNVFGGNGGLEALPQMPGGLNAMTAQPPQNAGVQSIFGESQGSRERSTQDPSFQSNVTTSQPQGGFLSRFMQ